MKVIGIGVASLVLIGVIFLSLNTLAVNKIIPLNPVSAIGLPVVTFTDVGSVIRGAQSSFNNTNNLAQGVSQTWRQVQTQLSSLTSRSQIVSDHVQTIVGDRPLIGVITPTTNPATTQTQLVSSESATQPPTPAPTEEPFYAKTLEYGKYLYCQEVVKDYEARNPALKPTARP